MATIISPAPASVEPTADLIDEVEPDVTAAVDLDPDLFLLLHHLLDRPTGGPLHCGRAAIAPTGQTCCGRPMTWRNSRWECDTCQGWSDPGAVGDNRPPLPHRPPNPPRHDRPTTTQPAPARPHPH